MLRPVSQYNCKIKSTLSEIGNTVRNVLGFVSCECGVADESSLFYVKVILNELLLNAIRHGNNGQDDKSVSITINMEENKSILIEVEDEGSGYDYRMMMDDIDNDGPCDICDCRESGRGLMIIKKLSKTVKFNENGNKITVVL